MTPEQELILRKCWEKQWEIAETPVPPFGQPRAIDALWEDVEFGPSYSPSWFGATTDAERQRLLRAIHALERDDLVRIFRTDGGRIRRLKLTPAGAKAAEKLTDAEERLLSEPSKTTK